MKTINTIALLCISFAITSCSKDENIPVPYQPQQIIAVPNGDFENWTAQLPDNWTTNSCPPCAQPNETYIVQQDTSAHQGQFAAKFIFNNVYPAWAHNGIAVTSHPQQLSAYVLCHLCPTDSVLIRVKVFNNNVEVDNGVWHGTTSINNYSQIIIPISQHASQADSVSIFLEGGRRGSLTCNNTEFWVDDVELH